MTILTEDEFRQSIMEYHTEMPVVYKGVSYFISDNMGWAEDGSYRILIFGPNNDEYVATADEALDRLIVDGRPLREVLPEIDWDRW